MLLNGGNGKPSFRKSYSIEYGYKPKKRTLIADAEFDREQHEEIQQVGKKVDEQQQGKEECVYTILVTVKDKKSTSILNLINAFNRDGFKVQHLETRQNVSSEGNERGLQENVDEGYIEKENIEKLIFLLAVPHEYHVI